MKRSRTTLFSGLLLGMMVCVGLFWTANFLYQRGRKDALVEAANGGNITLVRQLLAEGVDPNARGSRLNTETALMRAAANGHVDIVKLLLDHGADVEARHQGEGMLHGRTALFFAIDNRHDPKTIDVLLEGGADVTVKDRQGETCLIVALQRDLPALGVRLLEQGAEANATDAFGRPALVLAVSAAAHSPADAELLKLIHTMLRKGADVNGRDSDRNTIVFSEPGFLGGRIDTLSGTTGGIAGRTPLMVAARMGNVEIVKALLEKSADVQARDATGKTALQLAEEAKHAQVVDLLKQAGAKE